MRQPDPSPRTPADGPAPEATGSSIHERALGTLTGLALGDALGMPTQSMSPAQIRRYYGAITGLHDAVAEQPVAPSMPAGSVTDDTEQALILAGLLTDGGGRIDPHRLAEALLTWEDDMRARGSLDLLGPSTKHALEQVRAGADPRRTGREGTTNGAAMRVAPVGIAFSLTTNGDALAQAVHASCLVTHDTRQGFEAAGLIAAAVSAAIDGADAARALKAALDFVAAHPQNGHWTEKASVAARTRLALETSQGLHGDALAEYLRAYVGTSMESAESVPCALVIVREFARRPLDGLCFAAELGGDTDTIAAMAGAVLGASAPRLLPAEPVHRVLERSDLDLGLLCEALLAIRRGAGRPRETVAGQRQP